MHLVRTKRKFKMLRYPTKNGNHFPLASSGGRSLSTEGIQQFTGRGETLAKVLTKITSVSASKMGN